MRHRHPGQKGQAIVFIALMLTIIVGMAAIAIDGARAYALRRDLQAAIDAAALAAGDNLQHTGSYSSAEQAATNIFGTNLRLYAGPVCSPAYGSPGASSFTVTCTFSDGTILTQVVSSLGPQGAEFALSATRPLQLQFAAILTNGARPTIAGSATGSVGNLRYAAAITALDQAGCGGAAGSAVTISGGGRLTVIGDLVSAGGISVTSGALSVAGDIYARCQSTVPGSVTLACYPSGSPTPCSYPNVAGATRSGFHPGDPVYPRPSVIGGSQATPANDVVLVSGQYAADPSFSTNRCYFLSAGVYSWQAGYTNAGGFVSNELKPPDEPQAGNNTALGHQMWNTGGVNCAGAFQVSSTSGPAVREGTWAVELTATRTDTYAGINFKRESAPSMCRTVLVPDASAVKIQVSNVPGATAYNVYAAPPTNGCAGPFGFAGSIMVSGPVRNDSTAACPAFSGTTCSLSNESAIFDSTLLGLAFAPNSMVSPGVVGAYPPSSETPPLRSNLPNQNPDRATPPAGDRANENQCSTGVGDPMACPGPVTPGAVEFYIPSTGCLNASTAGDNFLFSGYQYNWLMVYEPGKALPPANSCSNMLGAEADSAWVGLIYTPAASLAISKAATFRTEATGGLMADTITFGGQLPTIIYSASYAPQPPAARLVY
ncbi:MAG TPA: pilus assembly protein TadG-related protein [Candidatus Sulfotelmatobacter sp.]|nr:pilus assembly protein TadG-related protein [Candidatus Sulfotelmatobacter sp.]